jgi:hypothetical protein
MPHFSNPIFLTVLPIIIRKAPRKIIPLHLLHVAQPVEQPLTSSPTTPSSVRANPTLSEPSLGALMPPVSPTGIPSGYHLAAQTLSEGRKILQDDLALACPIGVTPKSARVNYWSRRLHRGNPQNRYPPQQHHPMNPAKGHHLPVLEPKWLRKGAP